MTDLIIPNDAPTLTIDPGGGDLTLSGIAITTPGIHVEGTSPLGPIVASATESLDCDLCRRVLARGDGYHRVTVGMDDQPSHVGSPVSRDSTVEEVSELVVCTGCEPAVSIRVERLLTELWDLRRPDPVSEEDEPTLQTPPATERSL